MAWDDFFAPGGGSWIAGSKFGYQATERLRANFALLKRFQYTGTGSPEGVVTAPVGSVYTRSDGGAGTTLYVKQSGAGNTGWSTVSSGTGDLVGPASATDNAITRFDGTTGKLVQNSGITIADGASGTLSGTNSGDVSFAGTPNYLTLAGQIITRALIDLTTHVTSRLPWANVVQVTGQRLLGRVGSTGDVQEIAIGSGLALDGSGLRVTAAGGGSPALDDLTDVVITTPSNTQILQYNGTNWVNAAAGGGSGDSTTTDTEANKPAASNDGNLFFPNNGFYVWRDTGSAWAPWGPIYPMTPPVNGDFSWVNQGTSTVTTTNGGIVLVPQAQGGENIRARVKTAPGTPYVVTAGFVLLQDASTTVNSGLCFRESGTGKIVALAYNSSRQLLVYNFNSATSFNAAAATFSLTSPTGLFWFRLADNGTNLTYSVSADGVTFSQVYTSIRASFFTTAPDQVGFYANCNNAGALPQAFTLLSWKQT